MAEDTEALGPPWAHYWSEMIRTKSGGQAAASAGQDVLGCQKAAINRMLLAKADCLQTVLVPLFFTRRQQQVYSGIDGAGRRETP